VRRTCGSACVCVSVCLSGGRSRVFWTQQSRDQRAVPLRRQSPAVVRRQRLRDIPMAGRRLGSGASQFHCHLASSRDIKSTATCPTQLLRPFIVLAHSPSNLPVMSQQISPVVKVVCINGEGGGSLKQGPND